MTDFAAIDFETANCEQTSVCSVGVVTVRGGEVAEPDYYIRRFTAIHGLTAADTEHARVFPEVWAEIEPIIEGLPLVAHNKMFDEGCLRAVFRCYGMDYPDYPFFCTLIAARRVIRGAPNYRLNTIAALCGYDLRQHHHALADAEACAAIALKIL